MKINNAKIARVNQEINITQNFDEIEDIFKYKNIKYSNVEPLCGLLIRILINNYEHITFNNLTNYALNFKTKNNLLINDISLQFKNNIVKLLDYDMFPVLKFFNTNDMLKIGANYSIFLNICTNEYMSQINNKKILFIKLIGPYEITQSKLLLKFTRESFFAKNNDVKTLFVFHNYNYEINAYDIRDNENYKYKIFTMNEINTKDFNDYIKGSDICYLTPFNLYRDGDCFQDISLFNNNLNIINCITKNMNLNGDLILEDIFPKTMPHIQLFYLLFNNFSQLDFFKMKFTYNKLGFFVFKTLLNNLNMDNITNEYLKVDPYFGLKLNMDINVEKCRTRIKPNVYYTNYIISSIIKNKVPVKFMGYLTKINEYAIKKSNKHDKRISYVLKKLNIDINHINSLIKYDKNYDLVLSEFPRFDYDENIIYEILNENEKFVLEKCKKYNFEISDIYKLTENPTITKIIDKINDKNVFIDEQNKFQYINFTLNNNLSVISGLNILKLIIEMKIYFKNIENIIDINPNFGLYSLYFSKYFTDVIVINNGNNSLKQNIELFNFKNISLLQLTIYNLYIKNYINNKNYCIFIDIPINKIDTNKELYIDNINIISKSIIR
jgi:hypothetical protein